MALKKCKECGKEISTDAGKCPNCGKPQTKSSTWGCLIIIGIFFFAAVIIPVLIKSPPTQNTPPIKSKPSIIPPSTIKINSPEFIVTWHSGIFWGLLVFKNTTDKRLESLIYKFREAKKHNYLSKIIPGTNPGIIDNENAQITILIFSEPKWATLDQNNKYIHTRGPDIIARSYLNHIRASYEYDCISSKKESGSIGYDEGGLKSVHFKELF